MTRSRNAVRGPARQGGAMLLEALIAILIFSIGVLGIIGVQALAVQNSNDARFRSAAAQLADQLLGQMWIDNRAVANLQTLYNTCSGTTCTAYTAWATTVRSASSAA